VRLANNMSAPEWVSRRRLVDHRARILWVVEAQAVQEEHGVMEENPLQKLNTFGQSLWLDLLSRRMLTSGGLRRLIEQDGVTGLTSNPAIFEKAFAESRDYRDAIRALVLAGKHAEEVYETLVVEDIQQAADLLRLRYDQSRGADGYVSLEVSPHLARDTDGSLAEARWLWRQVNRPNLMIKVPGTAEGLPAIQQLLNEGINVNITLLFGLPRYREVAQAYLEALESRVARGESLRQTASVASFFLSRIDTLVDSRLETIIQEGGPRANLAQGLRGKAAVASAKVAYEIFESIFASRRFGRLADHGANRQRLLWASTGTKNPAYADTMYVEPLIGPETVTTLPLETLDAYRDHGHPAPRLKEGLAEAHQTLQQLAETGVNLDEVTRQLEEEGITKFVTPFDRLMETLRRQQAAVLEATR
jgi:transaldolase